MSQSIVKTESSLQVKFLQKYARDLKAESHTYAWILLLSLFGIYAIVYIFKIASNGKSYRHQQWISLYTQVSYQSTDVGGYQKNSKT